MTGKLLALGAVAAMILMVVFLRENPVTVLRALSPEVAAVPAPAPAKTEQPKALAATSAFDSIKVQAIIYNRSHPVTLINGKALDVGARINGVEVISIQPSNVVLACNGEQKSFKLK